MESQQMMELLLAMRDEVRSRHQANMKAWREEMAAMRDKWVNDNDVETTAFQEMEARQDEKKPTSLDRKPEAAQKEEVPKVDEVMPVGEPKKRRRDQKLAAERRFQKPKKIRLEKIVDPRRNWPSPAERTRATVRDWHSKSRKPTRRCPVARQWHDT